MDTSALNAAIASGEPALMPHTLPDGPPDRGARLVAAGVRRAEDAWAMHAACMNGFGAGEAAVRADRYLA